MRYLIIEEMDDADWSKDIVLKECETLFEAECALNRFLSLGHDAYLLERK